jgi:tetratricopeptide (TPR) repeat protein
MHRRHLALLGETEALARARDDRARLGQALTRMVGVRRLTGDHDGAMVVGRQALELATVLGDSALQAEASHRLGQVYETIGDFVQAAEVLRQTVGVVDREAGRPGLDMRLRSQAWLATILGTLGTFAEGRRHGEDALRLVTRAGRGDVPIMVHAQLGHLYLTQGELAHAIRLLEQGLVLCRASGDRNLLRMTAASLGYAVALQGRHVDGRALLEEAIGIAIRTGARQRPRWVAWLSEVCRLAGREEEAWQHAHQALTLARQQKERGEEVFALHQLGVVHTHADPPDVEQAEAHYRQAFALAEELGMRPLQAHCHRGLGTLYVQTGQRELACSALTTAIAMYRSMAMTFWLPETEAALAQVEAQ